MNRKLSLIALVLASAGGAANAQTGLAGDISIETAPFVSTTSRAEVRADVLASLDEIAAMHDEASGSWRLRFASRLSREEVVAEYAANRAEVAAMHGEDSGSALLASAPRATAWLQLATH